MSRTRPRRANAGRPASHSGGRAVAEAPSNIGLILSVKHHLGAQARALLDYGACGPARPAQVQASAVGAVASALAAARFREAAAVGFLLSGGIFGHDYPSED